VEMISGIYYKTGSVPERGGRVEERERRFTRAAWPQKKRGTPSSRSEQKGDCGSKVG